MESIELRDGPTVPLEAFHLALRLESLGYRCSVDGETLRLRQEADVLRAPSIPLNDDDREAIRRWKLHLIAITQYVSEAERVAGVAELLRKRNKPRNRGATGATRNKIDNSAVALP